MTLVPHIDVEPTKHYRFLRSPHRQEYTPLD
uniref:Uncharacterized protein n=1 Tax=Oryza sativa subsp. japonica TaxID=39947 RepID=Q2QT22_ORYSJ|nr:hypothetical protein LOC_Os12g22129 [Oryza sativa Japonica Group]